MKICSTSISERESRPVKKCSNEKVYTLLSIGNNNVATILLRRVDINGVETYKLSINTHNGVSFLTFDKNGKAY